MAQIWSRHKEGPVFEHVHTRKNTYTEQYGLVIIVIRANIKVIVIGRVGRIFVSVLFKIFPGTYGALVRNDGSDRCPCG